MTGTEPTTSKVLSSHDEDQDAEEPSDQERPLEHPNHPISNSAEVRENSENLIPTLDHKRVEINEKDSGKDVFSTNMCMCARTITTRKKEQKSDDYFCFLDTVERTVSN